METNPLEKEIILSAEETSLETREPTPMEKFEMAMGGLLTGALRRMQNDGRLKDSTVATYARLLMEFREHTGASFFNVSPSDVKSYFVDLQHRKIRASTIRKNMACLHSVAEYIIAHRRELGVSEGLLPFNPFTPYLPQDASDDVDFRNVAKPEDMQRVLSSLSAEDPLAVSILLCCKLLLRGEDIVRLRCEDVYPTTYEKNDVWAVRVGEDLTLRDLIVPKDLVPVLAEAKKISEDLGGTYLLVPEQKDRNRLKETLRKMLYRAQKKLGIEEPFTFNSLRNLGIALCRATDDELREHLAFCDDRHDRRFTVLREISSRVSKAADSIQIELIFKTVTEEAPKRRRRASADLPKERIPVKRRNVSSV